jgi:hypothetical protein
MGPPPGTLREKRDAAASQLRQTPEPFRGRPFSPVVSIKPMSRADEKPGIKSERPDGRKGKSSR